MKYSLLSNYSIDFLSLKTLQSIKTLIDCNQGLPQSTSSLNIRLISHHQVLSMFIKQPLNYSV